MRAALLWTFNDFPPYGMLSAWSTHGKLSCPICMEDTKAFTLKRSGKPTFFYCLRRFLSRSHALRKNTTKFKKERLNSIDLLRGVAVKIFGAGLVIIRR